jgi:glycosyltransferase involved in cell wall biosynthesis
LLVDPLDIHAIAAAMRYLINHPGEAEQMGERGREAILNRYNWPTEAAKLLALYARLTNHPTGVRRADDRAEVA